MARNILISAMANVKNVSLRIDEMQHIQKVRVGDVYRSSGGNYLADRR